MYRGENFGKDTRILPKLVIYGEEALCRWKELSEWQYDCHWTLRPTLILTVLVRGDNSPFCTMKHQSGVCCSQCQLQWRQSFLTLCRALLHSRQRQHSMSCLVLEGSHGMVESTPLREGQVLFPAARLCKHKWSSMTCKHSGRFWTILDISKKESSRVGNPPLPVEWAW